MAGTLVFVAPVAIGMLTDAGYEIPDWLLAGLALSYTAVRLHNSHLVLSEFGSEAESLAR
jgi:hypothetical protein